MGPNNPPILTNIYNIIAEQEKLLKEKCTTNTNLMVAFIKKGSLIMDLDLWMEINYIPKIEFRNLIFYAILLQ